MTKYAKSSELQVGLLVFIGLALIMGSVLILGGNRMFFTPKYYLKAQFQQVQGLSHGSVVSLSGIKVGNVESLKFLPSENTIEVVLRIEREYQALITEETIAEVNTQGALGDKYIFLKPGDPQARSLKDGEFVKTIKSGGFLETLSNKGSEVDKVFEIISEIHKLTKVINDQDRSLRAMNQIVGSTEKLEKLMDQSNQILVDFQEKQLQNKVSYVFEKLSTILTKIDRGEGTLGALINDPVLHERLKSLLGDSPRNRHVKSLIRKAIRKQESAK